MVKLNEDDIQMLKDMLPNEDISKLSADELLAATRRSMTPFSRTMRKRSFYYAKLLYIEKKLEKML